jgi:hypothetical protein
VIRCLQNSRDKLSELCRAVLFDEEVKFSENIDFQWPMKQACTKEIERFCRDVPHGSARVIRCVRVHVAPLRACLELSLPALTRARLPRATRAGVSASLAHAPATTSPHAHRCLQHSKGAPEFGAACKKEVTLYENRASQDYQLNWRLRKQCKADIEALCKDACRPDDSQVCARAWRGCARVEAHVDRESSVWWPRCAAASEARSLLQAPVTGSHRGVSPVLARPVTRPCLTRSRCAAARCCAASRTSARR